MEQARDDWELTATQPWIDRYAPLREDIRAALDWGLGDQGTHLLGIRLTVSAMPLWQELSLLGEHGLYVGKRSHGWRNRPRRTRTCTWRCNWRWAVFRITPRAVRRRPLTPLPTRGAWPKRTTT